MGIAWSHLRIHTVTTRALTTSAFNRINDWSNWNSRCPATIKDINIPTSACGKNGQGREVDSDLWAWITYTIKIRTGKRHQSTMKWGNIERGNCDLCILYLYMLQSIEISISLECFLARSRYELPESLGMLQHGALATFC